MKNSPPVTSPAVIPVIRVIKTGTCKSLSGKSDLTYDIGVDAESSLHLRVFANSASGYFSQEWVAFSAIQKILSTYPQITSFSMRQLYAGKSTNSPGFLLAVMKAEGLVKLKGEQERVYVALDAEPFIADMKALMEAQPDVPAAIKKAKSPK